MLVNAPRAYCATLKKKLFVPPGETKTPEKNKTVVHPVTVQQQVLLMSQSSSTDKAPSTTKHHREATQIRGEACVVLVRLRPRGRASQNPRLLPCLLRRWYSADTLPRIYPPSFDLELSMGSKGRRSYFTATKVNVIEYTRLR